MEPAEADQSTAEGARRSQARTKRIVISAALIALAFGLLFPSWPRIRASVIEHFILPRYESAYGFRGGRVPVQQDDRRHSVYAIVSVTAGGRFDRAGVAPGDLPSLTELRQALSKAEGGRAGAFTVVTQADWPNVASGRPITLDSWARPT